MAQEPPDNIIHLDSHGCTDGLPPRPFRVIPAAEFAVLVEEEWHINDVLPCAELVVVYGKPGSGKTFAILDMVMSIARGIEWNGNKTRAGRVIYVCAEGSNGFRKRVIAYGQHNKIDLSFLTSFEVIANAPNFLNDTDMSVVSKSIGQSDIIVIDTLSRIMAGGDENSSQDMSNVIQKCQSLHRMTGATVILVHHSGKDPDRGSRGWSGLVGAVDAEFLVEKFPSCHKISNTKQKDADLYPSVGFTLRPIVIGKNRDGKEVTSCTFELCEPPKTLDKDKKLGATEQLVVDIFKEFKEFSVSVEELIDRAIQNMPYDSLGGKRDRRREMVKQALIGLQGRKLYSVINNMVHKA